jgi:hypothetical protein
MAVYYVKSGATGAANGSTWADAYTTLGAAVAVATNADTIYVSQAHSDNAGGTFSFPATPGLKVICANDSAQPPTSVATGGSTAVPSSAGLLINGCVFIYGLTFLGNAGTSGANAIALGGNNAGPNYVQLDTCRLEVRGTNTTIGVFTGVSPASNSFQESEVHLKDCVLKFQNTSQGVIPRCAHVTFEVVSFDATGAAPAQAIRCRALNQGAGRFLWSGGDISHVGTALVESEAANEAQDITFVNCRIPSGAALVSGTVRPGGPKVRMHNCDSGATNYRSAQTDFTGSTLSETTIVKTGGASDGETPLSWRMVSTASAVIGAELISPAIAVWNDDTGSPLTIEVDVLTDGITLTDQEIWLKVQYLGSASYPTGFFLSDRNADLLASGVAQASSAATWTTTGLSSPVAQKLSVTVTPQMKGFIQATVHLAKPSTTVYLDPKLTVT